MHSLALMHFALTHHDAGVVLWWAPTIRQALPYATVALHIVNTLVYRFLPAFPIILQSLFSIIYLGFHNTRIKLRGRPSFELPVRLISSQALRGKKNSSRQASPTLYDTYLTPRNIG